jgi:hypothetical protein
LQAPSALFRTPTESFQGWPALGREAAGIALPPLLKKANLTVEQIDDSRVRLAARDQIRLLNLVADALRDDLLGVHLAQHCDLRQMGLLYYVLASSETVIEALRRAVRYGVLVNEGVLQQCTAGRQIRIAFKYVGVSRHLDRHQSEFWMLLIVRVLRQLTGLRISARRVRLVHARKKSPASSPRTSAETSNLVPLSTK